MYLYCIHIRDLQDIPTYYDVLILSDVSFIEMEFNEDIIRQFYIHTWKRLLTSCTLKVKMFKTW